MPEDEYRPSEQDIEWLFESVKDMNPPTTDFLPPFNYSEGIRAIHGQLMNKVSDSIDLDGIMASYPEVYYTKRELKRLGRSSMKTRGKTAVPDRLQRSAAPSPCSIITIDDSPNSSRANSPLPSPDPTPSVPAPVPIQSVSPDTPLSIPPLPCFDDFFKSNRSVSSTFSPVSRASPFDYGTQSINTVASLPSTHANSVVSSLPTIDSFRPSSSVASTNAARTDLNSSLPSTYSTRTRASVPHSTQSINPVTSHPSTHVNSAVSAVPSIDSFRSSNSVPSTSSNRTLLNSSVFSTHSACTSIPSRYSTHQNGNSSSRPSTNSSVPSTSYPSTHNTNSFAPSRRSRPITTNSSAYRTHNAPTVPSPLSTLTSLTYSTHNTPTVPSPLLAPAPLTYQTSAMSLPFFFNPPIDHSAYCLPQDSAVSSYSTRPPSHPAPIAGPPSDPALITRPLPSPSPNTIALPALTFHPFWSHQPPAMGYPSGQSPSSPEFPEDFLAPSPDQ